jgi:outer membrane protein insertion porin family
MKLFPRRWMRLCAILVACLQLSAAEEGPVVRKIVIKHVGPPAVSDELIRANIRVKEGEAYSRISIDDDIKNLYGTLYFYNIRVTEDVTATDVSPTGASVPKEYTLTYVVQGKPVITEIRFSGNKKYSTSRLRRKLTSKTGEPMDERKLFNDSQEILKMYQKAGLQKTTIEYKPSINEALGRGIVTFEVVEAPRVKIKDVVFDDAHAFKQRKLRRAIKTRRWWIFSWITSSGRFKDDVFEEDKEKLREFYADKGYIDMELKEPRFEYPKTNNLILHLPVVEGPQYKVGSVDFKGNELFPREQIIQNLTSKDGEKTKRGLQLKPGEVFSPARLRKDTEAIQDFYGGRGYIDARVRPERVANIEKGTLDLRYNVEEGDKFYVEKIEIQGNTKTKDKVIRRELAITPGETFDMVRVKVSKSRLEQMQFFEKVDTKEDGTDVPNRKNLVISLEEKNTGNIAVGAGFSSVDSLVGFVEVSQGNFDIGNPPFFTGGGQKARLRAQVGSRRQDYVFTFVEPWFLGKRLSLSTDLYHRDLNFLSDNFNQRQTGARIGLSRQLPHNFIGNISYTIESIGIKFSDAYRAQQQAVGSAILQEEGTRLVSRVGSSLAHDTRNNFLLPTRGHRAELFGELAGGPFGGDSDFYKIEARVAQYWSPGRLFTESGTAKEILDGHTVELTGRLGVVESYGDSDRVPLFDRWYLGGLYNLRGFKFRNVGPREFYSGEPIGGGTYWFSSAEYTIPIIERLRFALFYDIGMVYPDAYSFNPEGRGVDSIGNPLVRGKTGLYNDNWGIGIRLNLPIGPLRLDYGIPIHHDPDSGSSGRFQFGVGWTRDF